MRFKVGDKVKFLNETGGGVVSKIISPSMVNVMIADGFEMPTMTGELIRIDESGAVASMFDEDFGVSAKKVEEIKQVVEFEEEGRQSELGNFAFRTKNAEGAYMVFVPQDQKWLVTGKIEIYLVNHTDYEVLYSFFLGNPATGIKGIDYEGISPHSKILLDTIEREELEKWLQGVVQMMFHADSPDAVYMPVNRVFKLRPVRFMKEENFRHSEFIEANSLIYSIATLTELEPLARPEDKKDDEGASPKKMEEAKQNP